MRMPWFKTEPVDEMFFDTAPFRISERFDIPRPAAEVWEELTSDDPLAWCRILDGVTWTSPPPHGVGATRTVKSLRGASAFKEHFFRWEEGRRKSFYVTESSSPLFRHFAEDYLVEPVTDSSCAFTWVIAAEPRGIARFGAPLNKLLLGTLFRDTRKHFCAR